MIIPVKIRNHVIGGSIGAGLGVGYSAYMTNSKYSKDLTPEDKRNHLIGSSLAGAGLGVAAVESHNHLNKYIIPSSLGTAMLGKYIAKSANKKIDRTYINSLK